MKTKGYAKFGGGGGTNRVHYGKCGSGVLASLRKSKVLTFVVSERVFCTRYGS